MSENPRRGRQARNFTTNVPKILVLKSSSEQIFSRKLPLGAPEYYPHDRKVIPRGFISSLSSCNVLYLIARWIWIKHLSEQDPSFLFRHGWPRSSCARLHSYKIPLIITVVNIQASYTVRMGSLAERFSAQTVSKVLVKKSVWNAVDKSFHFLAIGLGI